MNKLILLFGLLLLLPIVLADNENGKITTGNNLLITRVDVKVDGLTSRNLDYNGEISRRAKPSSIVILSIKVENSNDTFKMEDITIIATIDDLNLEKLITNFNLDPLKDKISEIEFKLPYDVEDRDYNIFIEAEGDLVNGTTKTTQRVEYALNLIVEVPDKIQEQETDSLTQKINSLNNTITELKKDIGSYFEPYATCESERKKLEEQVKGKDAELANQQEYKARFDSCNNQDNICNTEKFSLQNDLDLCKYNITSVQIPELERTKNTFWMWIVLGIIAAVALYFYNEKRKNPSGEHEVVKGDLK